jgi:hypothetical protein
MLVGVGQRAAGNRASNPSQEAAVPTRHRRLRRASLPTPEPTYRSHNRRKDMSSRPMRLGGLCFSGL